MAMVGIAMVDMVVMVGMAMVGTAMVVVDTAMAIMDKGARGELYALLSDFAECFRVNT